MSPVFGDNADRGPLPPSDPGHSPPPVVPVVAGVVIEAGRVLVTRRLPADRFPLLWEFPGGKVEAGESHAEALVRELVEEIDVRVAVGSRYARLDYESDRGVTLEIHFYLAQREEGDPKPVEVMDWKWAAPDDLRSLEFIPSNQSVVDRLVAELEKGRAPGGPEGS